MCCKVYCNGRNCLKDRESIFGFKSKGFGDGWNSVHDMHIPNIGVIEIGDYIEFKRHESMLCGRVEGIMKASKNQYVVCTNEYEIHSPRIDIKSKTMCLMSIEVINKCCCKIDCYIDKKNKLKKLNIINEIKELKKELKNL